MQRLSATTTPRRPAAARTGCPDLPVPKGFPGVPTADGVVIDERTRLSRCWRRRRPFAGACCALTTGWAVSVSGGRLFVVAEAVAAVALVHDAAADRPEKVHLRRPRPVGWVGAVSPSPLRRGRRVLVGRRIIVATGLSIVAAGVDTLAFLGGGVGQGRRKRDGGGDQNRGDCLHMSASPRRQRWFMALASLCSQGSNTARTLTFRAKGMGKRLYSITSSARASSDVGTSKPNSFAVLALITSSNLTGAWTGRSLGFSPFKIRSTYAAARRYSSTREGP